VISTDFSLWENPMKLTKDHVRIAQAGEFDPERSGEYQVMVLNPKVRDELKGNPALFAVYRKIRGGYDSEVHPLHNPDYKEAAAKKEEEFLEQAKQHLAKSDEDFKTL